MKSITLRGKDIRRLPKEVVDRLVRMAGREFRDAMLLPTGAKAYARVSEKRDSWQLEVLVSGYAWDGRDVEPYCA